MWVLDIKVELGGVTWQNKGHRTYSCSTQVDRRKGSTTQISWATLWIFLNFIFFICKNGNMNIHTMGHCGEYMKCYLWNGLGNLWLTVTAGWEVVKGMIAIIWVFLSVENKKKKLKLFERAIECNWKEMGDVEASFCGYGSMKNWDVC